MPQSLSLAEHLALLSERQVEVDDDSATESEFDDDDGDAESLFDDDDDDDALQQAPGRVPLAVAPPAPLASPAPNALVASPQAPAQVLAAAPAGASPQTVRVLSAVVPSVAKASVAAERQAAAIQAAENPAEAAASPTAAGEQPSQESLRVQTSEAAAPAAQETGSAALPNAGATGTNFNLIPGSTATTLPEVSQSPAPESAPSGMSQATAIGISFGVLAILSVLLAGAYLVYRMHQKKKQKDFGEDDMDMRRSDTSIMNEAMRAVYANERGAGIDRGINAEKTLDEKQYKAFQDLTGTRRTISTKPSLSRWIQGITVSRFSRTTTASSESRTTMATSTENNLMSLYGVGKV